MAGPKGRFVVQFEGDSSPHTHGITVHDGDASVSEPRLLIDTNMFLEVLLGQERAADCLTLMKALERGTVLAYVTGFSLHSIEVMLGRLGKLYELALF